MSIYDDVRAGRPIGELFIDVHGHFGPWPETTIPYAMDTARAIADMDRYGCDQVWMSSSNPGYSGDLSVKNDYVFDFAAVYPDRILPYCTLSANTPERNVPELRRCLARGRCIGVKMHCYGQPGYNFRSDWLQPVFEFLAAHRLVYLNHTLFDWESCLWAVEKYPDLTFMAGHFWPECNEKANRYPNLRNCTCAAQSYRAVEREVQRFGRSDHLLVGSDFSLFQLGFGVGMVAYAEMAEEHKRNILGLNALELLRRTAWFGELKFRKPLPLARA